MIITVACQKGGTGKSSLSAALSSYAQKQGHNVLAVDLDGQQNLTYALGGDLSRTGASEVLTDDLPIAEATQRTQGLFLLSAGQSLATAEQRILTKPGRDFILAEALKETEFDLTVIDTAPALNSLLVNALTASDHVIIPLLPNVFSVLGMQEIGATIQQVRRYCNPRLTASVLLTRFKPRQTLAADMREAISQQAHDMGMTVHDTIIRESVTVEQSQAMQKSIFDYAPGSKPAKDYESLFHELKI